MPPADFSEMEGWQRFGRIGVAGCDGGNDLLRKYDEILIEIDIEHVNSQETRLVGP